MEEYRLSAEIAIYEPPTDEFPYLVVTFASDGMSVLTANSRTEARAMASERAIGRRAERKSQRSKASPTQPT